MVDTCVTALELLMEDAGVGPSCFFRGGISSNGRLALLSRNLGWQPDAHNYKNLGMQAK